MRSAIPPRDRPRSMAPASVIADSPMLPPRTSPRRTRFQGKLQAGPCFAETRYGTVRHIAVKATRICGGSGAAMGSRCHWVLVQFDDGALQSFGFALLDDLYPGSRVALEYGALLRME